MENAEGSLTSWPVFSMLKPDFISNIHMVAVYGSSGKNALIVTQDKMVYAVGTNMDKDCDRGDVQNLLTLKKIVALCNKNIKTFAHGNHSHFLALTQDGKVYSWGNNEHHQLGHNFVKNHLEPVPVGGDLRNIFVVDVACGKYHSLALTYNGEVYEWGRNNYVSMEYHLHHNYTKAPKKVEFTFDNKEVVCISCGDSSSMVVTADGEVYGWGDNGVGQLGIGNYNNQEHPCKVTNLTGIVIKKVVCGYMHTLALSNEGILYTWGANTYGQLGCSTDSNVSKPVQVKMPFIGRVLDIATSHYNHISVAMGECKSVFIWGHCQGLSIATPMLTPQKCLYDALASYATPSVMHKPFILHGEGNICVTDCLEGAFDDPTTSDFTINVQGKPIHVHKAILKIRCRYFRTMFEERSAENNQSVIEHEQFSYNVYRAFLKYLYTDRIDVPIEYALEFLSLTDTYSESQLKNMWIRLIKKNITVSNVMILYFIAIKHNTKELEESCFDFALRNMTAVIQTPNFSKLDEFTTKEFIIKAAKADAFRT